jgi:hypothetical protein
LRGRRGAADGRDSGLRGALPRLRPGHGRAVVLGHRGSLTAARGGPRLTSHCGARSDPTAAGALECGQVGVGQFGQPADRARVALRVPVMGPAPAVRGRCVILEQLAYQLWCCGELLRTSRERVVCHDPLLRAPCPIPQSTTSSAIRPASLHSRVEIKPPGGKRRPVRLRSVAEEPEFDVLTIDRTWGSGASVVSGGRLTRGPNARLAAVLLVLARRMLSAPDQRYLPSRAAPDRSRTSTVVRAQAPACARARELVRGRRASGRGDRI